MLLRCVPCNHNFLRLTLGHLLRVIPLFTPCCFLVYISSESDQSKADKIILKKRIRKHADIDIYASLLGSRGLASCLSCLKRNICALT